MLETPSVDDERGVDRSQIRRQLRMSVPDRIASMVATANTLMTIRARASERRIDVTRSA